MNGPFSRGHLSLDGGNFNQRKFRKARIHYGFQKIAAKILSLASRNTIHFISIQVSKFCILLMRILAQSGFNLGFIESHGKYLLKRHNKTGKFFKISAILLYEAKR
jgi:hypothetical protein